MTTLIESNLALDPPHVDTTCTHCTLPVPPGLIDPVADHQFCCPGCRAVYTTLRSCGLDAYYRLRGAAQSPTHPVDAPESSFAEFDSDTFHTLHVHPHPDGTRSVDLVLEGVTCAACVWLLERLPRVLPGVIEARLSLDDSTVRLTWDPAALPLSSIATTIARFGYTSHPARTDAAKSLHRRETRRRLIHVGVAGAVMGNSMLLAVALYAGDFGHMTPQYRALFRYLSAALGLVALAWPGSTFFRTAFAAIRTRSINLDVPIALALAVGGVAGLINTLLGRGDIYFDSLSVLIFLLLVGRFIQYRHQRQSEDALSLLFSLTPSTCHLVDDDAVTDVPLEALHVGDFVEVRPGELFPADGVVLTGLSAANQALLTGESLPTPLSPGSPVHAGAQNTTATLRIRITQVGRQTRVGRLMDLVQRGLHDRPPILLFTDRVGRWFTAAVSLTALAVFAFWLPRAGLSHALDHTIALLIVTCPCVLALATPMTLSLAIGQLARRDILVKSATALETLSRTGRLLLDKTGTLTEGRLELLDWTGDPSLKPLVASLESQSIHPIGRALHTFLASDQPAPKLTHVTESQRGGISAKWKHRTLRAGSPRYMADCEVGMPLNLARIANTAQHDGSTAVLVSLDETVRAVATLGDRLRADAGPALTRLRTLGWIPAILSGDAQPVVAHVAVQLHIPQALGSLSPEEKLAYIIGRPKSESHPFTVMVGDGVNDAAALAAADVGIAVHGGAEASLAAADIYIARPGLSPLVDLVTTSRRTMRTIRRNFAISLAYNLLAGTLAATGHMSPMVAAIIMPLSSATVLSLAACSARQRLQRETPWT